ncbi:MAG: hypothetical protein ACRDHZ_26605, partial [Ktedonobacteraceae bacterium]
ALGEAERLHEPKKLIADLYCELAGDTDILDVTQPGVNSPGTISPGSETMKYWVLALKNLEDGNCDVRDRIIVLTEMTEQSSMDFDEGCYPPVAKTVFVSRTPTPEEILSILSDRRPAPPSHADEAEELAKLKKYLAKRKIFDACSELSMMYRSNSVLHLFSSVWNQISPKAAPTQALNYLLVMQLMIPDDSRETSIEKNAAFVAGGEKQHAAKLMQELEKSLDDHDFAAISSVCHETGKNLHDRLLLNWSRAASKIADAQATFLNELNRPIDTSVDGQIALREKLKRYDAQVFSNTACEVLSNYSSLANLYMRRGRYADAEVLYKAVCSSTPKISAPQVRDDGTVFLPAQSDSVLLDDLS